MGFKEVDAGLVEELDAACFKELLPLSFDIILSVGFRGSFRKEVW
jgi:hypothetical protein